MYILSIYHKDRRDEKRDNALLIAVNASKYLQSSSA